MNVLLLLLYDGVGDDIFRQNPEVLSHQKSQTSSALTVRLFCHSSLVHRRCRLCHFHPTRHRQEDLEDTDILVVLALTL